MFSISLFRITLNTNVMLCNDSKRSTSLENNWLLNSSLGSQIRKNMDSISMDSIVNEMDPSLRIIATKCYDGETGLVSISGWRGHLCKETPIILFTVLDKSTQSKWTRLVENPSSKRQTLKVKVPRSVVHHQIVATAELLRENDDGACAEDGVKGQRCFSVESTSTCVAMATSENNQLELLISLYRNLSTDNSKKDFLANIFLEIERRSTGMAGFRLTKSTRGVTRWLVTVEEVGASNQKEVCLLPAVQDITGIHFEIVDGREYHVEATGLDLTGGNIFCQGSTNYKTDLPETYALDELRQLHQMAVSHAGQKSAPCVWLYRNKKPKYFREIFKKHKGIMKPYIKDNSGDPRSPINGRIDGLFFMASVRPGAKKGEPIPDSAFGTRRVLIPVEQLLAKASNLYFTDFYCMTGKRHYVTLVMTRPGSEADKFCAGRLLSLSLCDRSNNPFFFYDGISRRYHVSTKKQLYVELLFTEDLDISGYKNKIKEIPIGENCRGHSKDGGVPKNSKCRTCNLPSRLQHAEPQLRRRELFNLL